MFDKICQIGWQNLNELSLHRLPISDPHPSKISTSAIEIEPGNVSAQWGESNSHLVLGKGHTPGVYSLNP